MKLTLLKNVALGVCLAGTSLTAWAGPLQRADVPAEPAWVLHLDCDALRATTVGQYIQAEMAKPEAQAKLEVFHALFKLDLRTQLHGLTLYATGPKPADGVLLMYADVDAQWLVTLAKSAKDHQSTTHNQHQIHSWIEDKRARGRSGYGMPRVYGAVLDNRIVIFGQLEARVAEALDVLDHTAASLASTTNFAQLGAVSDATFIQAAARKLDLPDSAPNAELFRLTKQIRLQLGESSQQVKGTLSLDANDQEVANQMASILQGLIALMKLQKDNPAAPKLAAALSVKQDGASVTVQLALPANDATDLMKADADRKAKARAGEESGKQ